MHQQRPVLLLVFLAFMLSPSIIGWAINPQPIWYKPFLLWALVVLAAYLIQRHKNPHDLYLSSSCPHLFCLFGGGI